MMLNALHEQVAAALLDIDAVVFTPRAPITFKSGIQSPVYVDNRRLIFWPDQWQVVIESFARLITLRELAYDAIAGIAVAGIPHSSALAYMLKRPSVFVRTEAKAHGTRSQIEGGDVRGQRVLLVEDLVTTGSSSLSGVTALREAGATVTDCLCVTTYGFAEAQHNFDAAHVHLHPLTPFATIIVQAAKRGLFEERDLGILEAWLHDPHSWHANPDDAQPHKPNGGER